MMSTELSVNNGNRIVSSKTTTYALESRLQKSRKKIQKHQNKRAKAFVKLLSGGVTTDVCFTRR